MTLPVYRQALVVLFLFCLPPVLHVTWAAYPERPIRLVVGYPPGGGSDLMARQVVQPEIMAALGQPVIVDNRPGVGERIAANIVAQALPDGYTLMLVTLNFALNAGLTKNLPYDPVNDFDAITLIASAPMVLSINPSLPIKSVSELVSFAKMRPGKINYGSSGPGGTSHVAAELLNSIAKIKLVHVPYRGAGPALIATISGEVALYFSPMPPVLPHAKTGKLRMLGVTTSQRSKAVPDLPTMREGGVEGYEFATWWGLSAPAKTARSTRLLLHGVIDKALAKSTVQTRLLSEGAEPMGTNPDTFQKFLAAEISKSRAVAKSAGITLE